MKDEARLEPDLALAEALFAALREASLDPPGVTRDAYGPGEERAHALCIEAAEAAGLAVTRDFAGNSYATLAGTVEGGRTLLIGQQAASGGSIYTCDRQLRCTSRNHNLNRSATLVPFTQ